MSDAEQRTDAQTRQGWCLLHKTARHLKVGVSSPISDGFVAPHQLVLAHDISPNVHAEALHSSDDGLDTHLTRS